MDILCHFREDGAALLLPEGHPAMGSHRMPVDRDNRDSLDADGKGPSTLEMVRVYHPNAACVWLWRDGRWQEGMFETYQQQIDRLTQEQDDAVATLRKLARHSAMSRWSVEKRTLVDQDGEPWVHWADIARTAVDRIDRSR